REDDALRRERAHERVVDVVRVDLAEDVRLADAPRDQLGDLRTEIEDEDLVVHVRSSFSPARRRRRWWRVLRGGVAARAGNGAARAPSMPPAAPRRSRTARRSANRRAAGA